jgi:hypothetical protein
MTQGRRESCRLCATMKGFLRGLFVAAVGLGGYGI